MRFLDRLLLFSLFLSVVWAHPNGELLLKHLKAAENKKDGSGVKGIDFIYMINLDERPEKFRIASEQLNRYGVFPYRFSAVNGWKLSLEAINDVGLKFQPWMTPLMATTYRFEAKGKPSHEFMSEEGRAYFCHCMAKGTIGCCLSHISILKDAWDSGYETIWVLEDDIEVLKDPHVISDLMKELDALVGSWDVLFTDRDYRKSEKDYLIAKGAAKRPDLDCSLAGRMSEPYTLKYRFSKNFFKVSARFGTHSMIIRRSGIKKLLEYSLEHFIFLPYDMDNYLAPGLTRYCFAEDIVSNMKNSLSDNGTPSYENK
jgi:GR25 family glycosyltransferase involved in LPS biosynthesis